MSVTSHESTGGTSACRDKKSSKHTFLAVRWRRGWVDIVGIKVPGLWWWRKVEWEVLQVTAGRDQNNGADDEVSGGSGERRGDCKM